MTAYSDLRIGDTLPVSGRWRITGPALDVPEWYALRVISGREGAATTKLCNEGVEVAYPVETTARFVRGIRREATKAVIPGLIYAKFHASPQWHAMRERRIITGVVCRGPYPVILPPDIIRRVMGLPMEAERLAAAKAEMMRVREGEKARILTGPMAGLIVDVRSIKDGRVWWTTIWGRGETDVGKVERMTGVDPNTD